ncbi:tripartite tricarboxylate transporter permease [Bengtsoniella intestinalis]|uniref:tripartite tricarboxylate transporter permease n=1 Tax=Bengtsoniella intestinalis TaxID=3073143 RepID=UPI00391FC095
MGEIASALFAPLNLLMMNAGLFAGIIIGAMPGLSVTLAISLLLPLTFGMESIPGMFLLLGAYCGGTYGGSITAILIKTPGAPPSAATVMDGYPMAKQGKAGDALKIALVGSTVGGVISCFVLMFLASPVASLALKFGPTEYFSLCVFGLAIIASISADNLSKGLTAAGIGLLIATVGIDATDGIPRFMFGNMNLLNGFNSVIVLLGMFAVSEMLDKCYVGVKKGEEMQAVQKTTITTRNILSYWKIILKSSIFGTVIGAIPGTGGAIAAYASYDNAKRSSKTPEKFGTGCIEGVLAPEVGKNAVTGATLIPLLTLGIPGDSAVAVLLGALTMQGIYPGPELFTTQPFWVYTIMAGLLLINIFMYTQGVFLAKFFAKVADIPFQILVPAVMVLCYFGAYSVSNSLFDVALMMGFGIFGFFFKRCGYPIAPLTIALILGSMTEQNLRRAFLLSDGSATIFFTRPISLFFLILAVGSVVLPMIRKRKALKAQQPQTH